MANKRSIYMEGTKRTAAKCASDITETLARVPGVRSIGTDLAPASGRTECIRFTCMMGESPFTFVLRPNLEGVKNQFRRFHSRAIDDRKAEQIAWAQLAEWTKVQAAMIEGGQATVVDSFLSRLESGNGSTMGEWFLGGGYKQLTAGEEKRSA